MKAELMKLIRIKKRGLSILEMTVLFALILMISSAIIPSYTGYQNSIKKKLHVLNAITVMQNAQMGLSEGWITRPTEGKTETVNISVIHDNGLLIAMIDPSSATKKNYSSSSVIQLYNMNGVIEYYIKLKSDGDTITYVDTIGATDTRGTTQVQLLENSDITLE